MKTTKDVMIEIVQLIVLVKDWNLVCGVVLPSYKEVKLFSRDFYKLLDSVPECLMPKCVSKKINGYRYENGSVYFLSSYSELRGITFNTLYYNNRLSYKDQDFLRYNIYPCMRDFNCFVEFQ